MASLLDRAEQAVSVTALVRGFSAKLKEVTSRATDRLVVFKDNEPAAVILNVQAYQDMQDELENLRIEAAARDRLATFDAAKVISHSDMRARYANNDQ
ncbi:type II toxin-antitoxin system Phd/YefM family antitoxin [Pseudomonas sp. App30]|uniref:type II toxin-antitoxin system Phd/YefM family antitoxin n=1 Tax=Pseudomonas sp. App30 TaxID=3068990 RepID=UPI003A80F3FF